MQQEDLKKSIMLMGPICVGKSLISKELGKRLNMPVLSIDYLLSFIDMEQRGILSPSPEDQEHYIKSCLQSIKEDKEALSDEKYRETEIKLVHDFIDLYNYYRHLVGPFKEFYEINTQYHNSSWHVHTLNESIYCLKDCSYKVLQKALSKIDRPIIIDPPAPFGWEASKISFFEQFRMNAFDSNIAPFGLDKKIERLTKTTTSILLEPGLDYPLRNASPSKHNDTLVSTIGNYYENADIIISTNGLFFEPENKWFQQRTWRDAREALTKESLKNRSEISNICDEIVDLMEELDLSKS